MKDIINTKKFPFPDDRRLKQVKFIIFDGDTFTFWERYHNITTLVQDSIGCSFKYHAFSPTKPCWACIFFYTVNGVFTAFVDACGSYQDYHKLETYVFAMCGMTPTWDNHCDGNNTHNHVAIRKIPLARHIQGVEKDITELLNQKADMLKQLQENNH